MKKNTQIRRNANQEVMIDEGRLQVQTVKEIKYSMPGTAIMVYLIMYATCIGFIALIFWILTYGLFF